MSDEDIDLDRVVVDPAYRRRVIELLNTSEPDEAAGEMVTHPQTQAQVGGRQQA